MYIRIPAFLLSLVLLGSAVPALAVPGELLAVERRCGPPGAEDQRQSPVTNQIERTLIYRDALYLHFEPVAGGWQFISAWNRHLPMTRGELERNLPCFRDAMQDAAVAPSSLSIDPAIAEQTVQQPANEGTFGIPHFALIIILVVVLLVFLIVPSARQRKLHQAREPVEHIYRKPNLEEYTSSSSIPVAKPVDRDLQ